MQLKVLIAPLAALVLALSACGGDDANTVDTPSPETPAVTPTEEDAPQEEDTVAEDPNEESTEAEESTEEGAEVSSTMTVEEITLDGADHAFMQRSSSGVEGQVIHNVSTYARIGDVVVAGMVSGAQEGSATSQQIVEEAIAALR